jgi:hypothetical protein
MSTWIKLHDNFWRNPKILAAGEDAGTLYIQGLCYCSDGLTDGRIPTAALRTMTARKDARTLARVLVREGLWVETPHGWEVHDYLAVQRSRAQVEAEREATRARAARYRSRTSNAVTNGARHAEVTAPETDTETDNPTPTPPPPESATGLPCPCHWSQPCPEHEDRLPVWNPQQVIDPVQVSQLKKARRDVFGEPQTAQLPPKPLALLDTSQTNPEGRSD